MMCQKPSDQRMSRVNGFAGDTSRRRHGGIGCEESWPTVEMVATMARPATAVIRVTTLIGKSVKPTKHIFTMVNGGTAKHERFDHASA